MPVDAIRMVKTGTIVRGSLSDMTIHQRYRVTARQICVLEAAYPCLAEISGLWYFLPYGRPDDLSHDGRYILYIYRAALAAREAMRELLSDHRAEKWVVALDAEATFDWQRERARLPQPLERNMPIISEFASLTGMLALAA